MKGILIVIVIASLIGVAFLAPRSRPLENEEANAYLQEQADEPTLSAVAHETPGLPDNPNMGLTFNEANLKDIYLAGGCFWGLEAYMSRVFGVYDVTSGYANGDTKNPSYEDLVYRGSGHAETVHVRYDPERVDLETLLTYYLRVVDPTSLNKQGNDRGTQYRTGIYYLNEQELPIIQAKLESEQVKYEQPIVIEVEPLEHYYLAEEYHQDYLEKNPNGYCHIDLYEVENVVVDPMDYAKPSDDDIKMKLDDLQYKVTQQNGTEYPFENTFWDNKESGIYVDIVTGEPLFLSTHKYDSGTGWPSFTEPISEDVITYHEDKKLGVTRIEVRSRVGDSHLGHVFPDGPSDQGGLRYCMNSAAMDFIPLEEMEARGYGDFIYLVK